MSETRRLDLALQGGGAHGAFTWGVMDRLLEDERIEIEGISGTSAGAMNGVVMADALTRGDAATARTALREFWRAVSQAGMASPVRRTPLDMLTGHWSLDHSPGYIALDLMSRLVSPYQFNPFDINPLRDIVAARVDFERVRACQDLKLYVTATNVRSGKQRIFSREEMSLDAVMASACLPTVFQAVEIDGEAYWDGGYMGNPSLSPLLHECTAGDIMVVQITPLYRADVPTSAADIMNRLNEITFNAALIKEMKTIAMLQELLAEHDIDVGCYRQARLHHLSGDEPLSHLSASSKLNPEWAFLCHLHELGRSATDAWLTQHFDDLGKRATLDLAHIFQEAEPRR